MDFALQLVSLLLLGTWLEFAACITPATCVAVFGTPPRITITTVSDNGPVRKGW
jgi:hypothetical protein